jgi:hypothetical protein
MNDRLSRPLSEDERAFLEGVAAKLSETEAARLRQDLQMAQVAPEGDFLLVDLLGYERPDYRGHHNLPFEGKMSAADGSPMSLLVNMDQNDRLLALEFIRWESPSSVAPDWSTLTVVPKPPMGASKW